MHEAKLGDRVRIEYSRVSKPGTMIASPHPPKILEFTVGSGDIIPSVSLGVVGMVQGDRRRLAFQPETENGIVPAGLGKQTSLQRLRKRFSLRIRKPRAAANSTTVPLQTPTVADGTSSSEVIELDVLLLTLDASASANKQQPQFEMGGEG